MKKEVDLKSRRVLVVEKGAESLELMKVLFDSKKTHLSHVEDRENAVHRVIAWKPHLLLLNADLLADAEAGFLEKIHQLSGEEYMSVILLVDADQLSGVETHLKAGADDYLLLPLRENDLKLRLSCVAQTRELFDQLKKFQHRIDDLSSADELTGLMNVKSILKYGDEDISRCRRFKKAVSTLIIDVDHFSSLNETYGFQFGSSVIQQVGQVIKSCVRKVDRVARVGADEFMVILPETDLSAAEFVGQRIRDTVQGKEYRLDRDSARATVSIGVAGFDARDEVGVMNDFYRNASEAMRGAKNAGGNRVEVFSFA